MEENFIPRSARGINMWLDISETVPRARLRAHVSVKSPHTTHSNTFQFHGTSSASVQK
jgi:hypothetical protein